MKKLFWAFLILAACTSQPKQSFDNAKEAADIKTVLNNQVVAWNDANIDEFMKGYWKSDSIQFIGSKVTHGWDSTLARYKRSYPGKAGMGQLRFEILKMDFISDDACLITGKYFLTRENDNPSGIFTLLFRKINNQWVIVYDHTS
ncbi:MAG: DUF4440 domain-containing protein [Cyclobacteriaceae bacterium]